MKQTDQTLQWDIDFYPRGIRYGKAQLINVFNMPGSLEIPETLLRTVRLSVSCKSNLETDQRFMVRTDRLSHAQCTCTMHNILENIIHSYGSLFRFQVGVLITGVQNNIQHVRTVHVRTYYFSTANPTLSLDNLLPYDELELSSIRLSPHLTGKERNMLSLQVIIAPMGAHTCHDTVPFEFK